MRTEEYLGARIKEDVKQGIICVQDRGACGGYCAASSEGEGLR